MQDEHLIPSSNIEDRREEGPNLQYRKPTKTLEEQMALKAIEPPGNLSKNAGLDDI